ncbi:class I SAM-dependent methyltransferase [Natronobiforma cellulositropha]|uniref:class I SAM-dependent methyltransferase n=1 Tax=Natronobiforma cellulositropha TaxID=1679076 RepID=UPI0021D5D032|nr:class I SAM-dependent methyltransferase [Natronobiforma cellulositropha]
MGFHTFPIERADALEDPSRYRFCSREELLELLAVDTDATVADLGSGTGFYSREIAPFVATLYAIDLQAAMHARHRAAGLAQNVVPLTAAVDSLPFDDGALDAAVSTMTHHEYADEATLAELARVIRPGGPLVTVDWSATGTGEDGPPLEERFTPDEVVGHLETAGFTLERVHDRPETLAVVARR